MVKTCSEILADVREPEHPAQEYFAKLDRMGKRLHTCSENGCSQTGYPLGRQFPNFLQFRAETKLHELTEEVRKDSA